MNRSRIEWCDHTWNPITGCLHNCPYCYAKTLTVRFSGNVKSNVMETEKYHQENGIYILEKQFIDESGNAVHYPFGFQPTLHRYRYDFLSKLKMGTNIFVGAVADVFGEWIPEEWIVEILEMCKKHPQHNYMFLTKNPIRYMQLASFGKLPEDDNFWYGSTITGPEDTFWWSDHHKTFVSVEPLLKPFDAVGVDAVKKVDWVIIGAETGRRKEKVIPEEKWIDNIVNDCRTAQIPIFMKESLLNIVGEEKMCREFPEELTRREISEKVQAKLRGTCMICRENSNKSSMVTLIARTKRGGKTSSFGYMCKECFRHFCHEHGVEVPELEGLEGEKNG